MGHTLPSIPNNSLDMGVKAVMGSPVAVRSPPEDHTWKMDVFKPKLYDAQNQQTFQLSPTYNNY
jgi:hypothetical protein